MRAPWWVAGVLAIVAVVVAAVAVPWRADVGPWPWADLDHPAALATFPAPAVALMESYSARAWLPATLALLAPVVTALALAWMIARRQRRGWRPRWGTWLTAAALLIVVQLSALAFEAWLATLQRSAGLLREPWLAWTLRWVGEAVVIAVVGATVVWLFLLVLRRWPRRGWPVLVAAATLLVGVGSLLAPALHLVDGTRSDPALRDRLMALADRAGVSVSDVVVVEVADRTTAVNAVVSGWGPTRTIAVYDTVPGVGDPGEASADVVDALVAHELIHVARGDVLLGTLLAALAAAAATAAMVGFLTAPRRRDLPTHTPASLVPVVVAALFVAMSVATPLGATVSRPLEARADREAVALTDDPQAYADLLRTLAIANRSTLEPGGWRYSLVFTHPTVLQRIAALG